MILCCQKPFSWKLCCTEKSSFTLGTWRERKQGFFLLFFPHRSEGGGTARIGIATITQPCGRESWEKRKGKCGKFIVFAMRGKGGGMALIYCGEGWGEKAHIAVVFFHVHAWTRNKTICILSCFSRCGKSNLDFRSKNWFFFCTLSHKCYRGFSLFAVVSKKRSQYLVSFFE